MGNGFFGYSIVGDLLSGTGLRIAYSILLSVPLIGPGLAFIFFGGRVPTPEMIPRMYALHIFIVPAVLAALLGLHLLIIWRQKHTNYPGPGRTDRTLVVSRLWPSYAVKSFGLTFYGLGNRGSAGCVRSNQSRLDLRTRQSGCGLAERAT